MTLSLSERLLLYYLLIKAEEPRTEKRITRHIHPGIIAQDLTSLLPRDGSRPMTGNLDMDHNYITESDRDHWMHFTMAGGATNITINIIPSGVLNQDRHYHRLIFAVDAAPGGGKTANLSLTNGTSTMTVTLGAADTSGYTTTNEFDWDVSAESLTLKYSQTAGGAATKGFVAIKYHYKENA